MPRLKKVIQEIPVSSEENKCPVGADYPVKKQRKRAQKMINVQVPEVEMETMCLAKEEIMRHKLMMALLLCRTTKNFRT